MAITTSEFEQSLNDFLTRMENWKHCEWCGDGERHIGPRSKLCNSCKEWRSKERRAIDWKRKFTSRVDHESLYYEYCIQYAALCRAAGTLRSWEGPISPVDLEWELEALTDRFLGESVFGSSATFLFGQFSPAQRRLLKYMFQRMTNVWLRHHRRSFAIDEVMNKAFPATKSSRDE